MHWTFLKDRIVTKSKWRLWYTWHTWEVKTLRQHSMQSHSFTLSVIPMFMWLTLFLPQSHVLLIFCDTRVYLNEWFPSVVFLCIISHHESGRAHRLDRLWLRAPPAAPLRNSVNESSNNSTARLTVILVQTLQIDWMRCRKRPDKM